MNAIEMLKHDHENVSDLMKKIDQTTEKAVKTRESLLHKMKSLLQAHEAMEEKIFYPALKEKDKDRILEAYEEHHVIDKLLAELESMDCSQEEWKAKFTVLKELIEHHVEEEEEEIFPEAKSFFGRDKLDDLGLQMEEVKENTQRSIQ